MADGFVQVSPDSSGKKVDTTELTRTDGTVVERQRVVIGDASNSSSAANVTGSGGLQADGSQVIQPVSGSVTITNDASTPVPITGQTVDDLAFVGGVPLVLGQATRAASIPVAIASDQPAIPVLTPAVQAVTAADGAFANDGTTQDQAVRGDVPGTDSAKLRGINDGMQALIALNQRQLSLLQAILDQLNAMGIAQGVAPAALSPLSLQ